MTVPPSPGQYLVAMTGPWRDLEQRLEFENEAERPLRESGEGESEGFEGSRSGADPSVRGSDLGRDPELDTRLSKREDAGSVYSETGPRILSSEEPDSDHDGWKAGSTRPVI